MCNFNFINPNLLHITISIKVDYGRKIFTPMIFYTLTYTPSVNTEHIKITCLSRIVTTKWDRTKELSSGKS